MNFKGRFIDDILFIIDVANINVDCRYTKLVSTNIYSQFLKFTTEFSFNSVNFLDLNISLNANIEIVTSISHKPVSKHEYLHFYSDHPRHMIKAFVWLTCYPFLFR